MPLLDYPFKAEIMQVGMPTQIKVFKTQEKLTDELEALIQQNQLDSTNEVQSYYENADRSFIVKVTQPL